MLKLEVAAQLVGHTAALRDIMAGALSVRDLAEPLRDDLRALGVLEDSTINVDRVRAIIADWSAHVCGLELKAA